MQIVCPKCGARFDTDRQSAKGTCSACGTDLSSAKPEAAKSQPCGVQPGKVKATFGFAVIVTVLILIVLQLAFAYLVVDAIQDAKQKERYPHSWAPQPGEISYSQFEAIPVGYALAAMSLTVTILYLIWVYRSYANLFALEAKRIRFSDDNALMWHFCPLANLFMVPKILDDLWLDCHGEEPAMTGWPMYLCLFYIALTPLFFYARSLDERMTVVVAQTVVAVIGGALLITIVRGITRSQEQRGKAARELEASVINCFPSH